MLHRNITACVAVALLALSACGDDSGGITADTLPPTDTITAPDTVAADTVAVDTAADTAPGDTSPLDVADTAAPPEPTPVCVAIRGNGELITSHFAALARIAELFGPFEGVAGGSSASITSFLTESMHMHPLLWSCAGGTCTRAQAGARLGLLYKSLFGYLGAMTERDEAVAVSAILGVIQLAKDEGIGELVSADKLTEAWQALVTLFESEDVRGLVNPEVVELLKNSPDKGQHVKDIWNEISSFGGFGAADPIIFVRPGLINFPGLASQLGRIGSFYAGYGAYDEAAWRAFLDGCAEGSVGQSWPIVATIDAAGTSCGARFAALLSAWRADFVPQEATIHNRVEDRVGQHLRTLAITSVLTGQAAVAFEAARAHYVLAEPWTLEVAFADVKAGYWGAAVDVSGVVSNPKGYTDLKTSKALTLGQGKWRDVLSLSPAEPGLARAQALDATRVSAGGWPDLEPVLALKNAGCERVIYLTRRDPASNFGRGVAQLLGASAADDAALYDLSVATSSFSASLSEADGVWCTNWNAIGPTDLSAMMADAYNAPFEVHGDALVPAGPAYAPTTTDANLVGCTPGVVE
ncbi:MAG: hypothetical protein CVU56_18255 [Deltaproteobacteria bacterium HGW-Deltaproteobacteria-14]|jgi:hypothetical protein|nr:MAG: hypothetical protein CVU56_18255 [Deltaproteobacteria bacterium HGW-Deltaproteobacteria-14]